MLISVGRFVVLKICCELLFNQALHYSRDHGIVVDLLMISQVRSCAWFMYADYVRRFPLEGKSSPLGGEVECLPKVLKYPRPTVKIAGGNESGSGCQLTFVFSSNGSISFGKKVTDDNVSEVWHGGHEVRRPPSIIGNKAKNLLNTSAISQGLSR